jgi:hypothetical protein
MADGLPWISINCSTKRMTRTAGMLVAMSIPRHCRLASSITFNVRIARPL